MSLLFDKLVKAPVFGCQQCGQCLLSQTAYVCPMTCPKGLRNGPCGGTLDGRCEVLPDQPCVWVNINQKEKHATEAAGLRAPYNPALVGTSSLGNFITGKDSQTRLKRPYASKDRGQGRPSVLARQLAEQGPVVTYEIASPRDRAGLERVAKIAARIKTHINAVNTTTNAGGIPSVHSLETAQVVAQAGIPPIVQFCGRDQDAGEFQKQIDKALRQGFANMLVLTGDWNPATERGLNPKHWFPMDSIQMVDILARQSGYHKQPLIGVASNPYSTPMSISLQRFFNKLAAGAHFSQTQMVSETEIFGHWLAQVRQSGPGKACRILASVPLIGKRGAYEVLQRLPGVRLAESFKRRLEAGKNLAGAGLFAARKLIMALLELDIDGIHLMNFGVDIEAVIDLADEIRLAGKSSAA